MSALFRFLICAVVVCVSASVLVGAESDDMRAVEVEIEKKAQLDNLQADMELAVTEEARKTVQVELDRRKDAEARLAYDEKLLADAQQQAKLQLALLAAAEGRVSMGGNVLVVPTKQMDAVQVGEIAADLRIMSRILDKSVAGRFEVGDPLNVLAGSGAGRSSGFLGDDGRGRAIYLQGYGAVFVLRVGFPLQGPLELEADQEKPAGDSVWQQTKSELSGVPKERSVYRQDGPWYSAPMSVGVEFDAGRVEQLKDKVVGALKHAANLGGGGGDDRVVVAITGTQASRPVLGDTPLIGKRFSAAPMGLRPAVLSATARKADIDSFAEGQLDGKQFREKVEFVMSQTSQADQPVYRLMGGEYPGYYLMNEYGEPAD